MKLLLLLVCGVLTALGDDAQLLKEFAAENVLYIGELYKELLKKHSGNFIVSPLAVQNVFGLVNGGARGNTSKQITTTLHLPESQEKINEVFRGLVKALQINDYYTLISANKIYLAQDFKINEQYKRTAVDVFRSEIQNIDFGESRRAVIEINKWVEEKTHEKIKNLLSEDVLTPDTALVLINSLYFQGKWVKQFGVAQKSRFYSGNGNSVVINMMSIKSDFNYYESQELKAQFLELPYEGGEITMTIVLPNSYDGLPSLEDNIENVLVTPRYYSESIEVKIPKFKVESTVHLVPILEALGIRDAFTDLADFRGIGDSQEPLSISEVIQKAFIEVDEKGTTAAAATAVVVESRSGHDYKPLFVADHPFLFYLKHRANGIFFIGRYSIPEKTGE